MMTFPLMYGSGRLLFNDGILPATRNVSHHQTCRFTLVRSTTHAPTPTSLIDLVAALESPHCAEHSTTATSYNTLVLCPNKAL